MLVPMRILLDHAAENEYGLAAFNVNNMEQIQAIMEAANETESPVIIQASRGRGNTPMMRSCAISFWLPQSSIPTSP
jgi:fructose/tagatose bisphosphate aldolase